MRRMLRATKLAALSGDLHVKHYGYVIKQTTIDMPNDGNKLLIYGPFTVLNWYNKGCQFGPGNSIVDFPVRA